MMGFVLQDGCSPLHVATRYGHLDVVKTLTEAGANIDQVNKVSKQKCNTFTHSYTTLT